jgi:hypothetical protein
MSLTQAREFLIGAYHDLPNILFIGSLILGSITGYLSLVWVSLGLIINAAVVAAGQGLLKLLFPKWSQVVVKSGSMICEVVRSQEKLRNIESLFGEVTVVAPSYWMSSAVFFAIFIIYNSIRVALRAPERGVSKEKVDVRRAFSMSIMVIATVFLALILGRSYTGCETWLGGALGSLIGGGLAIGYWHLLDACDSGIIPDILQVVSALAPAKNQDTVPVVCTPPPK